MKTNNCNNCHQPFIGNYCSHCGQRDIANQRLQMVEVVNDFFDNTFNFHKGFFYTFWNLMITPGKVAHSYINGQRKLFTNPTRYMVIALAFQTFVDYWFKTTEVIENDPYFYFSFLSAEINKSMELWNVRFAVEYILFSNLFMIVVMPGLFHFLFKYLSYNYTELLATSFYFIPSILFITMPFLFITKVVLGINVSKDIIIMLFISYMIWSNLSFFKSVPFWPRLLKILIAIIIFMILRIFFLPYLFTLIYRLT